MSDTLPAVGGLLMAALGEPKMALLSDTAVLELLTDSDRIVSWAETARTVIMAEAERRQAAEREMHCSTAEHLRRGLGHTLPQCRSLVRDAVRQGQFPRLMGAQAAGKVHAGQATVIARTLADLPDDLSAEQLQAAETTMVEFADEFGPVELLRLGWRLLETVAPDRADDIMAEKLEREEAAANKRRGLSLSADGHGSMTLKGRLPISEGEELAAVLNAHAESRWKSHLDEHGSDAGPKDKSLLMADALMAVVRQHQAHRAAPTQGGDRPRVMVLLSLTALISGLGMMTLGSGACITATEARRMACDCDLIPSVLNAHGVPLDLGRSARLVTPALRAALVARDQGCVFPGCDRGPLECEAHHVRPWWADGPTSLDNLVLLCPRHHRKVEPGRGQPWDADNPYRWQIHLDADRLPTIIPPAGYDPDRKPLRHDRFRIMRH